MGSLLIDRRKALVGASASALQILIFVNRTQAQAGATWRRSSTTHSTLCWAARSGGVRHSG